MEEDTQMAACPARGERTILHVDMNCFYAAVECLYHPELAGQPVAVGGHVEDRHGIILAKNQRAKDAGVKTGEALWQARQKCPGLVIIPPDYRLYLRFSRMARELYYGYTDLVEPFGPDEAWLDITGSCHLFADDPVCVAQEISERIKTELGVTVSVGVSWNKIFAKFGSDYEKPDAITCVTRDNYRTLVWDAPVRDLLYVGRATERKLHSVAIFTIGELANASPRLLENLLGKMGLVLQAFANGRDTTPVRPMDPDRVDVEYDIKSIGNGLTAPRDLTSLQDAEVLVYLLAESVAQRLRAHRMRARVVGLGVREGDLTGYTRQMRLPYATNITSEIARHAASLLRENEDFSQGNVIRALHVRASDLVSADEPLQLDLFDDMSSRLQAERLDTAVDTLRHRFGNQVVRRAVEVGDQMSVNDIERDNIVHPVGFFHEGAANALGHVRGRS